jgi:hypothetical protein
MFSCVVPSVLKADCLEKVAVGKTIDVAAIKIFTRCRRLRATLGTMTYNPQLKTPQLPSVLQR